MADHLVSVKLQRRRSPHRSGLARARTRCFNYIYSHVHIHNKGSNSIEAPLSMRLACSKSSNRYIELIYKASSSTEWVKIAAVSESQLHLLTTPINALLKPALREKESERKKNDASIVLRAKQPHTLIFSFSFERERESRGNTHIHTQPSHCALFPFLSFLSSPPSLQPHQEAVNSRR